MTITPRRLFSLIFLAAALLPGGLRLHAADAASSDQVVLMPELDVSGFADKGYQSGNAMGATKTNTPIVDLAYSIQEINPELMRDIAPNDMFQAVRYVSSVAQNNDRIDTPLIRGFVATLANDGLLVANGINLTLDMGNIERMEVVKGASAVMYGSVPPGGLVNLIHKQASDQPAESVELEFGTYDFYRGVIDVNLPVFKTEKQELDFRSIASGQDYQSFQVGFHQKKYLLSQNLKYRVGSNTEVTLRVDYFDAVGLNNSSLPYDFNGVLLHVPISFDRGEPSLDQQHNHYLQAELIAVTKFGQDWSLKFSTNYTADNEYRQETFLNTPPATTPTQWVRYLQVIPQIFDSDVSEFDLLGNFNTGPVKHKVLIGAYILALENLTKNVRYGPLTPNLNVLDPVYGAGIYTVGPLVASALRSFTDLSDDWAVFVQDQMSTFNDHLYITVGGRQDYNVLTTTNTSPLATGQLIFNQVYTQASPRAAALFKIMDGLSVYASYDQSFTPAPGSNSFAGTPFPPPTAVQREAGIKWALFDGRVSGSASTFQIERNNVTTTDPINPGFSVAVGQVESTGWETDIAAYILPHWQIFGGYGHYHNFDSIDTTPANIGGLFVATPWWTLGVFSKVDFKGTKLEGLEIGAGVSGMSGIPVNTGFLGPFTPASYVLNPEISYSKKTWRISFRVENVLNNDYIVFASSDRYVVPGQPRELYVTLKKSF